MAGVGYWDIFPNSNHMPNVPKKSLDYFGARKTNKNRCWQDQDSGFFGNDFFGTKAAITKLLNRRPTKMHSLSFQRLNTSRP
jgi:hypothetical protein